MYDYAEGDSKDDALWGPVEGGLLGCKIKLCQKHGHGFQGLEVIYGSTVNTVQHSTSIANSILDTFL